MGKMSDFAAQNVVERGDIHNRPSFHDVTEWDDNYYYDYDDEDYDYDDYDNYDYDDEDYDYAV